MLSNFFVEMILKMTHGALYFVSVVGSLLLTIVHLLLQDKWTQSTAMFCVVCASLVFIITICDISSTMC